MKAIAEYRSSGAHITFVIEEELSGETYSIRRCKEKTLPTEYMKNVESLARAGSYSTERRFRIPLAAHEHSLTAEQPRRTAIFILLPTSVYIAALRLNLLNAACNATDKARVPRR